MFVDPEFMSSFVRFYMIDREMGILGAGTRMQIR